MDLNSYTKRKLISKTIVGKVRFFEWFNSTHIPMDISQYTHPHLALCCAPSSTEFLLPSPCLPLYPLMSLPHLPSLRLGGYGRWDPPTPYPLPIPYPIPYTIPYPLPPSLHQIRKSLSLQKHHTSKPTCSNSRGGYRSQTNSQLIQHCILLLGLRLEGIGGTV